MNSELIVSLVLLALSVLGNVILIAFITGLIRRHDAQVDKLTNKIMARDLTEYSVVEPRTEVRPNQVKEVTEVPIAEADPEAVMRSLAEQTGRASDYTDFGGAEL